jgi:hypothetical protein
MQTGFPIIATLALMMIVGSIYANSASSQSLLATVVPWLRGGWLGKICTGLIIPSKRTLQFAREYG